MTNLRVATCHGRRPIYEEDLSFEAASEGRAGARRATSRTLNFYVGLRAEESKRKPNKNK